MIHSLFLAVARDRPKLEAEYIPWSEGADDGRTERGQHGGSEENVTTPLKERNYSLRRRKELKRGETLRLE